MSFGFSAERRRRARRLKILVSVLVVAVAAGAIAAAYREGLRRQVGDIEQVAAAAARSLEEARQSRADADEARREVAQARADLAELQGRYQQDVPGDALKPILQAVGERLAAGILPERLLEVVLHVQNSRSCDPPTSRRFIVRTPNERSSPVNSVSFADNTISIAAEGASARDASGNLEAWFDPAQPVSARIAVTGGSSEEISGKLPLHHSVVLGDVEHRFTLVPGPRGFLVVTADRCRFP